MGLPVLDAHFHCPACGPLVRGQTRVICGRIIPLPVVGNGPWRECPDCKTARRTHRKENH